MAYDIGPRIGIQGEAEFNRQIKNINNALRECGSEMKALSSEFEDNANSQDALIAKNKNLQKELDLQRQKMNLLQGQYDKQVQKLNELAQAYQKAKTENGEMSSEASKAETAFNKQAETVSKLSVAMNETQNYMNKLGNSMSKNDKMLDEIASGARDAATGLSEMGDEADDASKQLDDIASSTKAEALSGLADNIASVGESIKGVVEDSREYLQIMGQLDASSQRLGYTTQQTEQTYTQLYGILGDQQTAATATANLQALGLSQQDLAQMTELAIGAWAQYGDSIPIDSLAEAINETAQVGTVTGTFADALNWAGISEDDFNTKLASTSSESERARMIMAALKSQGLDKVAEGYRENNSELIKNNEAQAKFDDAMANLAENVMPAVTDAVEIAASAIGTIAEFFSALPDPIQKVLTVIGTLLIVFGAIAPAALSAAAAFSMIQVPLLPLIGTIALVVAAVVGLIVIFKNLWDTNEGFRNAVGEIWAQIQSVIQSVVSVLQEIFQAFTEFINVLWNEWGDTIMAVVSNAISYISDLIQNGLNIIKNVINLFTSVLKGDWSGAWNAVKNIVTSILKNVLSLIRNTFGSIVSVISGFGSKIFSAVKSAFSSALSYITSLPGKAISWGKDFMSGLADGIASGINKIIDKVKGLAEKIKSFLHFSRPDEGPLRDYETWMPDFMSGLADGIYRNIDKIQKAASDVSGTINSTITGRVADIASNTQTFGGGMIVVEGDTMILDGKVIGKTAVKYITGVQVGAMKTKGQNNV
mgnify:FL=1